MSKWQGTDDAVGAQRTVSAWARFVRLLGLGGNGESSLRESLEEVIEEHEETTPKDALGEDERSMLKNVLRYGDLHIDDVMVPRADIIALEISLPFREVLGRIAEAAHSRLPVYRDSLDEVIGMVHVKDVLRVIHGLGSDGSVDDVSLEKLLRPVLFVPPSMKLFDVLTRMRTSRTHMAIVVDEYGGSDGLVTVEDLVEEIVGEIEDEHDDAPEDLFFNQEAGVIDVDARAPVEALEKLLNCDLLPDERDEDIETVGGLVVSLEGRVPAIGESVVHPLGYRFEILSGDARRLVKLRLYSGDATTDDGSRERSAGQTEDQTAPLTTDNAADD